MMDDARADLAKHAQLKRRKLTPEQVELIRTGKVSAREAFVNWNISAETFYKAKAYKTYKELP